MNRVEGPFTVMTFIGFASMMLYGNTLTFGGMVNAVNSFEKNAPSPIV